MPLNAARLGLSLKNALDSQTPDPDEPITEGQRLAVMTEMAAAIITEFVGNSIVVTPDTFQGTITG